jgi:acyl carrier protein
MPALRMAAPPDAQSTVLHAVQSLLQRRDGGIRTATLDSDLHEDLDLDSLELAELSVMLEDNLGRDPYMEGVVPRTVGEIVAFYG